MNKPLDRRGRYRVLEGTQTLAGPRKRDPQITVRRILVHSSANAAAQQAARTRRLESACEELDKLERACGGRRYATAQRVTARIGVITSKRRIGSCLVTSITVDEAGRPTLTWHYDQEALAAEAATDGWYALLTTLDPAEADVAEVLVCYKGQPAIERRYSDFKGPLAVAPVFLHHNRRIAALITVICLALLCSATHRTPSPPGPGRESDHARALPRHPDPPPDRTHDPLPARRPQDPGRNNHRPTNHPDHTRSSSPPLLELLGIYEAHPRWLDTSNPTCEIRV
ncbi:hypothetical protein [Streptomyces sp. NPDC051909]|uniref:hypothetical protein n=1 Tax=Streptomyces sp. NPDC051909 TaxID=3154944 RepID=UPI003447E8C6